MLLHKRLQIQTIGARAFFLAVRSARAAFSILLQPLGRRAGAGSARKEGSFCQAFLQSLLWPFGLPRYCERENVQILGRFPSNCQKRLHNILEKLLTQSSCVIPSIISPSLTPQMVERSIDFEANDLHLLVLEGFFQNIGGHKILSICRNKGNHGSNRGRS